MSNRIMIFADYYLPGLKAGGPVKTVSNIVHALKEDFIFFIFTRDRDLGDNKPYKEVQINEWVYSNKLNLYYSSKKQRRISKIFRQINRCKVQTIYLNSFFSFDYSIKIVLMQKIGLINKKIILAPRGEFSPGALNIKLRKKMFYLKLAKLSGLYKNVIWHSTSELETEHIKKIWGKFAQIKLAQNLGSLSDSKEKRSTISKKPLILKIAFVSRIVKKKNLQYVLELFNEFKFEGEVTIDVFGSVEDKFYYEKCVALANDFGSNIKFNFRGFLENSKVVCTLSNYHLFFFPTLGENFGHVILEALLAGCPLLISDQTPWTELETKKIGWDLALHSKSEFANAIQKALLWTQVEFDDYSNNAYSFGLEYLRNPNVKESYYKLFEGD